MLLREVAAIGDDRDTPIIALGKRQREFARTHPLVRDVSRSTGRTGELLAAWIEQEFDALGFGPIAAALERALAIAHGPTIAELSPCKGFGLNKAVAAAGGNCKQGNK